MYMNNSYNKNAKEYKTLGKKKLVHIIPVMEQRLEDKRDQLWMDFTKVKDKVLQAEDKHGQSSGIKISMACLKDSKKFFWLRQENQFKINRDKTEQVGLRKETITSHKCPLGI